MIDRKYEKQAAQFCAYVKALAEKPENLKNLEIYLSIHFGEWIEKYAYDPNNICAEMREFANMVI